jgi:hypothetical protein
MKSKTSYRFDFLSRDGAVFKQQTHRFADDVTALEYAVDLSREHAIEIWDGQRRVALVKKDHAPLDEFDRESL